MKFKKLPDKQTRENLIEFLSDKEGSALCMISVHGGYMYVFDIFDSNDAYKFYSTYGLPVDMQLDEFEKTFNDLKEIGLSVHIVYAKDLLKNLSK